jgi:hypothetical protein
MVQVNWGLAVAPADRRAANRTRIECPANLHLTIGVRQGMLWDLSTTGARIHTDNPPRTGTTALLKWQTHEAFCKVVWTTENQCGVQFDRPIARTLVDETVEEVEQPSGPVAAVGNIPLGQKRSRP